MGKISKIADFENRQCYTIIVLKIFFETIDQNREKDWNV